MIIDKRANVDNPQHIMGIEMSKMIISCPTYAIAELELSLSSDSVRNPRLDLSLQAIMNMVVIRENVPCTITDPT